MEEQDNGDQSLYQQSEIVVAAHVRQFVPEDHLEVIAAQPGHKIGGDDDQWFPDAQHDRRADGAGGAHSDIGIAVQSETRALQGLEMRTGAVYFGLVLQSPDEGVTDADSGQQQSGSQDP